MLMIYQLHMPGSNASLVIAIKARARYRARATAILLDVLRCTFFQCLSPRQISGPYITRRSPITCCTAAMLVLLMVHGKRGKLDTMP